MNKPNIDVTLPINILMEAVEYASSVVMITSFSEEHGYQKLRIDYVNRAFKTLTEYKRSEIYGLDPFDCFKVANPRNERSGFKTALFAGKTLQPELEVLTKGGQRFWVNFLIASFSENGRMFQVWTQQHLSNPQKINLISKANIEFLSNVFKDSNELVFSLSKNNKFLYVNPAFTINTGFTEVELHSLKLLDVFQQSFEDSEDMMAAFHAAWQGIPQQCIASIKRHKSRMCWYRFTVTPIMSSGLVIGVYATGFDETKEIIEKRLNSFVKELLTPFDSNSDLQGNLTQMLVKICKQFQLDCGECWLPDQQRNKNRLFAWHYPANDFFRDFLAISSTLEITNEEADSLITIQENSPSNYVKNFFLNSNFPRKTWAEKAGLESGFSFPIVCEGRLVATLTFFHSSKELSNESEISQLIQLLSNQLGIRIERSRLDYDFNQVFELVPDFICLLDVSGRFFKANRHLRNTLGKTAEELYECSFFDFVEESFMDITIEALQRLKTDLLINFELVFLTSKSPLILEWSLAYNPQDGIIYGAAKDITALKASEESLVLLNDALQVRAKQLQGFNKELEQFAYIVSHDLQEPLRMISSFMKLLLTSNDIEKNEKSVQYINFAIDGAVRMKRLIQDLLTYSRAGTTEEDFSEIKTSQLLSDTLGVYQQLIRDKNAVIHVEQLDNFHGIPSLIGQVFDNIISNALKYCDKAYPEITISSSKSETHIIFCFSDNGIGIENRHFETIYLPFKRLHNINEYSGTGIGLAVCKKIADKHHGNIWVESTPNEGSKFFFSVKRSVV